MRTLRLRRSDVNASRLKGNYQANKKTGTHYSTLWLHTSLGYPCTFLLNSQYHRKHPISTTLLVR